MSEDDESSSSPFPLATMSGSPPLAIIDSQVLKGLRDFCAAFQKRYSMQPPEFSDPRGWYGAKDIYDDYSAGIRSCGWFKALLTSAQELDLAGLDSLADPSGDGYQFCMIRCIQFALLKAALARDRAYQPVSPAFPRYFRGVGWDVPAHWNCEIQASNEEFLALASPGPRVQAHQDASLAAAPTSV